MIFMMCYALRFAMKIPFYAVTLQAQMPLDAITLDIEVVGQPILAQGAHPGGLAVEMPIDRCTAGVEMLVDTLTVLLHAFHLSHMAALSCPHRCYCEQCQQA
jgi:hypothetical protein